MSYVDLHAEVLRSLDRALDGIEIVSDLYATEAEQAARGLKSLILHPDDETGRVSAEVMEEIHARDAAVFADHSPRP